ncbi:MAG: element excision factor XisI family protein [Jaaginema sp. PMC 1079.18]|nr:element excision factor XisI family protein [Jaaginema sp. PMC 1080.18]MEC4852493.1 element excision factor XisI family protein [Jaaginema sp. PMC 1079.18]MEC4868655.1 element excision factor XisI family protein [Jaaginema sp. PMC 1078.18]
MDKLEKYRQVIKNVLTYHYELVTNQSSEGNSSEVRDRLAFDDRYHNYLWYCAWVSSSPEAGIN